MVNISIDWKKKNEFDKAKKIIQKKNKSLCGFTPVKSHPFNVVLKKER